MNSKERAYRVASLMEARNTFLFKSCYISYVLRGMDSDYKQEWPQTSYDEALRLIAEARTEIKAQSV